MAEHRPVHPVSDEPAIHEYRNGKDLWCWDRNGWCWVAGSDLGSSRDWRDVEIARLAQALDAAKHEVAMEVAERIGSLMSVGPPPSIRQVRDACYEEAVAVAAKYKPDAPGGEDG